jgi:hypothetical protein
MRLLPIISARDLTKLVNHHAPDVVRGQPSHALTLLPLFKLNLLHLQNGIGLLA